VFHVAQSLDLLIIIAMYLSSGKSSENGAFGAKNQSPTRINFSFLIWPDQAGSFRRAAIVVSRRCFMSAKA